MLLQDLFFRPYRTSNVQTGGESRDTTHQRWVVRERDENIWEKSHHQTLTLSVDGISGDLGRTDKVKSGCELKKKKNNKKTHVKHASGKGFGRSLTAEKDC